jgi:hypothetical protein
VATSAQSLSDFNTSRVVEVEHRKGASRSLKNQSHQSSGGIVPCKHSGTGSGGIRTEKSHGRKKYKWKRIDDLKSLWRIEKFR